MHILEYKYDGPALMSYCISNSNSSMNREQRTCDIISPYVSPLHTENSQNNYHNGVHCPNMSMGESERTHNHCRTVGLYTYISPSKIYIQITVDRIPK